MAVVTTRQVRPLTTLETADESALSVAILELAHAMNNYGAHVGVPHLIVPQAIPGSTPPFQSDDGETAERVIHMFAPRHVPFHLFKGHWQLGGYLTGAGTCAWKLYSSRNKYDGPAAFDASFLAAGYGSSSITIDSTTEALKAAQDLNLQPNAQGETNLTLTAQNSSGIYCYLTMLGLVAQRS